MLIIAPSSSSPLHLSQLSSPVYPATSSQTLLFVPHSRHSILIRPGTNLRLPRAPLNIEHTVVISGNELSRNQWTDSCLMPLYSYLRISFVGQNDINGNMKALSAVSRIFIVLLLFPNYAQCNSYISESNEIWNPKHYKCWVKSPFCPCFFFFNVFSQVNHGWSWLINKEQAANVMSCYTQMKRHTLICTQETPLIIKARANMRWSLLLLKGGKADV